MATRVRGQVAFSSPWVDSCEHDYGYRPAVRFEVPVVQNGSEELRKRLPSPRFILRAYEVALGNR